MGTSEWLDRIEDCYANNRPFVSFVTPKGESIVTYFQKDPQLYEATQIRDEGFHLAPFLFEGTTYYMPLEQSEVVKTKSFQTKTHSNEILLRSPVEEQDKHESLVARAVTAMANAALDKVVVSRRKEITLNGLSIRSLVTQLFDNNSAAFKYLWFHPKTSLWCGATPEILLVSNAGSFSTMSLAGTKLYNKDNAPNWQEKERHEQHIVTEAICDGLENFTTAIKVSKTYNHRAGNLMHLRTDVTGILKKRFFGLNELVAALHPTPAVCGRPKALAASFIQENEGYEREFYTGFIGTSLGDETELYVNLRCMKIMDSKAYLYVGGGITHESNPNAEWQETQDKLQTMLQVLYPVV